ncbi:MAG TPA: hypothetical protein VJ204_12905 [Solirubrobacterales bacterium]|nr:hypothetical protein [Solirubrobacterales bacterium]
MAVGAGSASALTGGGKKPSEAPLVAWGQHYEATVGNNKAEANYLVSCCSSSQVAFWHLGPLSVHDQVVVNWHELPFAHGSGYPVRMVLVENAEDFSWGSLFGREKTEYQVSGSGSGRTEITVQNSSTNDYLEFYSRAEATSSPEFETYPYDFSVEAPRHYLGLSLGSVSKVAANGYLHATASLATGAPVPDGSGFTLTGTWSGGGVFTVGATSVAGQITFPLAVPETAFGKDVEFVATSAATSEYQAAASSKIYAEVTKPPAPPAPPKPVDLCTPATNKAHAWARIYKRRMKNAERARGRSRRRLLHDAHTAEGKFIAARAAKKAAC